ncbi:ABC transporter substrate-binding protein [Sediminibacillus massiliensis]|uniref:ABC transporter substrate-binding protein n=1 Tax=Sediminibacillus massiliensis TaxID=1926277 RepID=UPI0009887D4F|nr:extracellular solute-binding protein [Sediminibacillus massiliensis]
MVKKIGLLVAGLMVLLGLMACSSDESSGKSGGGGDGDVTLTMWAFPGMGLDSKIEQYMEENPNVKIEVQEADYNNHHQNLITALGAGSGAPDIAVIESAFIERLKENQDQFYNLNDYGAEDIKDDYLEWRWREASSVDGSFVLGVPTDVGPMAMAYRTDLFEEAGLPTEPEEVDAAFATWEDYIEAGRQLKEATGSYMFNLSSDLFTVIREQATEQYFDENGELIIEESEQIAKAWDLTVGATDIQANIEREETEWGAAIANGDIATVFLPPWMLQQIKDNGPDTSGLWNVAQIPEASGNWGGSLLSVPKQSDKPQEAYDFISWLMSPENQLDIFKEKGNFPSTPEVYQDEELQSYSDEFFTRDDLGSMFAEAAERVEYVYRSPDTSTINTIMGDALASISDNGVDPDKAWDEAMKEIDRQTSR